MDAEHSFSGLRMRLPGLKVPSIIGTNVSFFLTKSKYVYAFLIVKMGHQNFVSKDTNWWLVENILKEVSSHHICCQTIVDGYLSFIDTLHSTSIVRVQHAVHMTWSKQSLKDATIHNIFSGGSRYCQCNFWKFSAAFGIQLNKPKS